MGENKDLPNQNGTISGKSRLLDFFHDVMAGFGIGIAFIIPGFSGGSIAAILGIYEKLIGAIANIFRDFKRSVVTLIPIFIGLVIGAVSLLFPLGWALRAFPLPTVSLFVGLALGGMFSVTNKIKWRLTVPNYFAFIIPCLLALALSFAPTGVDVDLFSLNFGGYILLFIIGIVASAALVVPGISGSMILLILGYYNPIINLITEHFFKGRDMITSLLVLGSVGLGIVVGFIGISMAMKLLLDKYPRGTYVAIIGFIIGSIPTVFISTAKDAGMTLTTLPSDAWHWIACVLLLAFGFALAFLFVLHGKRADAERGNTAEVE